MQQPQPTLPFAPRSASHGTGRRPGLLDARPPLACAGRRPRDRRGVQRHGAVDAPRLRTPPVPHIHPIDEWFYVMEGEMTVELGDQTIIGRAGDSLWIRQPRQTA